jgi:flagellar biogenesis protein FliO
MDLKEFMSSFSANPKQVLKIVLLFSVVMLTIWLLMVSQMDVGNRGVISSPDPEVQARADSMRVVLNSADRGRYDESSSSDLFLNAFTTFMVLLSILGALWFWAKSKHEANEEKSFSELGTQMLGQNAHLKIIEINDEVWVLAVTANSVDLLHRYSQEEWNRKTETPAKESKNKFYQLLSSQE